MDDDFTPEIMEMMDDLQKYQYYQETNGKPEPETDRYGMPFEPVDSFSTAPLGFLETAMRMQVQMMELFRMACRLNRHSPEFIRISGQLEKLTAQMGRCCITKAVLEQQGQTFEFLSDLTIGLLRGITAVNYRKLWSAFMEVCTLGRYSGNISDLSIRWAALDTRLKATQEKIEKIRSGEIKAELKTISGNADSRNNTDTTETREQAPVPFSPNGRALSVDRDAVREFTRQQPEEQPDDASGKDPAEVSENRAVPEAADETADPVPPLSGDNPDENISSEDEWDGPYVSDNLIRRMADYWQKQAMVPVTEEWDSPP